MSSRTANLRPIPILVYHQVDAAPPKGTPYRSLIVAPSAFARQMFYLRMFGFQALSMTALQPYLRGERQGKVVGLTFDDGYLNNLQHALPVLQRHGFSATCYVVSQRLGQHNDWDLDNGIAQKPLMTAAHLRAWVAGGQEVGAHTRHHSHLPLLDAPTARDEIVVCKQELEAALDAPVAHFCYPYGEYGPEHVALAQTAGFETVTTTQRGRVHQEDWMQLPRVPVLRSTTWPQLWLKTSTAYEDRRRT